MNHVFMYPPVDTPYPLGRHVEHDPRSRAFAYTPPEAIVLKTVAHRCYGLPLNQGNLGSCTGNAAAGALNTLPLHKAGDRIYKESDAVELYHLATVLDGFPGTYPPEDTGSSGIGVAKACRQKNYIDHYAHAFNLDSALNALQKQPVITGVNWYEQMFYPTAEGFVHIGGQVAGGHEFLVRGYVKARKPYVLCVNSWGSGWGSYGHFKMFVEDWKRLLSEQGDVTILRRA